ncbi:MAG: carboxypeptidase-like regulatory domain-containing protein [Thermoplasmatota archaeon]
MKRLLLLLLAATLAGCADDAAPADEDPLPVTATTGCLLGVVVDETITPVADATVRVASEGLEQATDGDGAFQFCDLSPGTYFVAVDKPLYSSMQSSWDVKAGVADPAPLKMQIQRIPGLVAYVDTHQFEGFYECAFATVFITDSCDMAARTAHDAGAEPVPRNLQNNVNTAYVAWSESISTVVQETFWDDRASNTFRSSLQDTPIDNDCDCSTKHMERAGTGGYILDRMDKDNLIDKNTRGTQSWPVMDDLVDGQVAVRGFIPFQDPTSVDYAIDLRFDILTTFFHNHTPPAEWTFESRADYPPPS